MNDHVHRGVARGIRTVVKNMRQMEEPSTFGFEMAVSAAKLEARMAKTALGECVRKWAREL